MGISSAVAERSYNGAAAEEEPIYRYLLLPIYTDIVWRKCGFGIYYVCISRNHFMLDVYWNGINRIWDGIYLQVYTDSKKQSVYRMISVTIHSHFTHMRKNSQQSCLSMLRILTLWRCVWSDWFQKFFLQFLDRFAQGMLWYIKLSGSLGNTAGFSEFNKVLYISKFHTAPLLPLFLPSLYYNL